MQRGCRFAALASAVLPLGAACGERQSDQRESVQTGSLPLSGPLAQCVGSFRSEVQRRDGLQSTTMPLPPSTPGEIVAAAARDSLVIPSGARVVASEPHAGATVGAGTGPTNVFSQASTADIVSYGAVNLFDGVSVSGSVRSASDVTLLAGASVTGQVESNIDLGCPEAAPWVVRTSRAEQPFVVLFWSQSHALAQLPQLATEIVRFRRMTSCNVARSLERDLGSGL